MVSAAVSSAAHNGRGAALGLGLRQRAGARSAPTTSSDGMRRILRSASSSRSYRAALPSGRPLRRRNGGASLGRVLSSLPLAAEGLRHISGSRGVVPEAELTFLLAGGRERRSQTEDRMRALAQRVSASALRSEMDRHRARLVLGRRAHDLGLTRDGFNADLAELRARAETRGLIFDLLTRHVTDNLERRGIEALPLKGVALATSAHGGIGTRLFDDIDILVRPEQMKATLAVLRELGYERDGDLRSSVHATVRAASPATPPVEVHWRVHWYGDRFASCLLAESSRDAEGLRSSSPAATLAALLLFYAKDGFAGLRLAIDIAAYADAAGSAVTGAGVLEYARHDPLIRRALLTALWVAQETVGLELGVELPPLDWRAREAARLQNWSLWGDPDQIRATVRLVDALLAPPGRAREFARARLRPFRSRRENVVYAFKTLIRWCPALAATTGGRTPHPLPVERDASFG